MMRILDLPGEVLDGLRSGKISAGHARTLLAAPKENQLDLYRQIISSNLTVRDIESVVSPVAAEGKKERKREKKYNIFQDVVDQLMGCLGTKVRIYGSCEKGKIEIDFFSKDDLNRLLDLILKKEVQ